MLEILSFIDELNELQSKTVDLTSKRQISSVIDKYQKIADDMERRLFDEYNGDDNNGQIGWNKNKEETTTAAIRENSC